MRTFEFVEPYEDGTPAYVRMTEAEVISWYRKGRSYPPEVSDEQIIDEFCVVHWAYEVKDCPK